MQNEAGEEIMDGRQFFERITNDYDTWEPRAKALTEEQKAALMAIPQFEGRRIFKLPVLESWMIDEREEPSIVNPAMEQVKAILGNP